MILNIEKAFKFVAKKENINVEELELNNVTFFADLRNVFEYVYTEDNDYRINDLTDIIQSITVDDMKKENVDNVIDYLAITWEHLTITPYGYVTYEI